MNANGALIASLEHSNSVHGGGGGSAGANIHNHGRVDKRQYFWLRALWYATRSSACLAKRK